VIVNGEMEREKIIIWDKVRKGIRRVAEGYGDKRG
jgi:hypothetical protein